MKARGALCLAFGGMVLGCPSAGGGAATEPKMIASDSWCPDGFEQSTSDACFAIPTGNTKDAPVLVYLHAMFAGRGSSAEWEAVRAATKRGFAVVLPRGRRGACEWRAELKDDFCWPQDAEDVPAIKATVAEWDKVLWQAEALLDKGTHRRYVLGSGNGAAFAEVLATQGLFQANAFVAVDGATPAPGTKGRAVPLMLVAPEEDREQAPKMKDLHEALTKSGWSHAWCPRTGAPALAADDVDMALRFFKRDADGALKGNGPLGCR